MVFPRTKEELKQRLLEEANQPTPKITVDEYKRIYELSQFKCLFNKFHPNCNMSDCPAKPDNIWESYDEECHQMRQARNLIARILNGDIIVDYNSYGWEIPV